MRTRLEPLRGLWLGWGILLAWAAAALPAPASWVAPLLGAATAALPRTAGTRACLALGILLESLTLSVAWEPAPPPRSVQGGFAVVLEREVRPGRWEGVLREAPEHALAGRRVRVASAGGAPGTVVAGRGSLREPRSPSNPGGFDEARWAASAGLAGTLRFDSAAVAGSVPAPARALAGRVDASVRRILSERLDGPSADLWIATLLADGSRLPPSVDLAFRETGLYHMLSVSGFHLVVLGGAAIALLSLLRAGATASTLGALATTWAYVAFLDWPDPAVRSGVAFTAFALARWTGRRPHAGNALGLGVGTLVLLDPNCPFQAGVQLTVAATAALVWVSPGLEALLLPRALPNLARTIGRALTASVAATLATAPILAWNTGLVPWIGIPAGVLASGFFSAGFLAALATVATGWLPAAWGVGFAGASDLCARAVLEIALRAGGWDGGWLQVVRPSPAFLLLWSAGLAGLALCAVPGATRRRALVGLALLVPLLPWLPEASPHGDALAIDVLDVGQGDAILVRSPDGATMLVDGGPATPRGPRPRDAGTDVVLPALRALRARRLDAVAVTHPDLDHWGGVPAVARAIPPDLLLESGVPTPEPSRGWDAARAAILRGPTRPLALHAGQFLPFGRRGAVVVLAPGPGADLPDRNSGSLVLSVRWGRARALLAGDAEAWSEDRMLAARSDLRADVLKVAHHGSKGASSQAFLDAVRPRWAALSCGERNRYGHPHPEAVRRLSGSGAALLDTRRGAWEALLHPDGRVEIAPACRRWWKGPWRTRGDVSLPPSWIWNGLSRRSSTARRWCAGPSAASSTPTTNCPTASPARARTDRS